MPMRWCPVGSVLTGIQGASRTGLGLAAHRTSAMWQSCARGRGSGGASREYRVRWISPSGSINDHQQDIRSANDATRQAAGRYVCRALRGEDARSAPQPLGEGRGARCGGGRGALQSRSKPGCYRLTSITTAMCCIIEAPLSVDIAGARSAIGEYTRVSTMRPLAKLLAPITTGTRLALRSASSMSQS